MEEIVFIIGLIIAIVGVALLLIYGFIPAFTGNVINIQLAAIGAVLILIGGALELLLARK